MRTHDIPADGRWRTEHKHRYPDIFDQRRMERNVFRNVRKSLVPILAVLAGVLATVAFMVALRLYAGGAFAFLG